VRQILKVSLSLLITLILSAAFLLVAFSGLFDLIEASFFQPRIQQQYQRHLNYIYEKIKDYHRINIGKFLPITKNPAVFRAYLSQQSAEDIFIRTNLFGKLREEFGNLRFVRLIGKDGKKIHFSTLRSDIRKRETYRIVYYNLDKVEKNFSGKDLVCPENKKYKLIIDAKSKSFIYSFPVFDNYDIYRGSALFYVSKMGLENYLFNIPDLGLNDLTLIGSGGGAEVGGVLINFPPDKVSLISGEVLRVWNKYREKNSYIVPFSFKLKNGTEERYLFFFLKDHNFGNVGFLIPRSRFSMQLWMKVILSVSFFMTVFLLVFLILNLRQDPMVILSERIKRFQIEFLREYVSSKEKLDWERWRRELTLKQGEVKEQIKKGIGRISRDKQKEVDELIDKSWEEIINVIGKRIETPARVEEKVDLKRIEEIIQKALSSGRFVVPVTSTAEKVGKISDVEGGKSVVETPVREEEEREAEGTSLAGLRPVEVEELDEEEVEEIEEIEEAGEEEVEEIAPVEELEEVEEVEEIEEAEPLEEVSPLAEEAEEVEELEEVEEIEEISPVEEVEPAEEVGRLEKEELEEAQPVEEVEAATPVEEIAPVEELEEVEEVEEIEEAEPLEEVSPLAEEAEEVEELEEVEGAGEMESLEGEEGEKLGGEELEEVEEIEEIEEAEEVEEVEEISPVEEGEQIDEAEEATLSETEKDNKELEELESVPEIKPLPPEPLETGIEELPVVEEQTIGKESVSMEAQVVGEREDKGEEEMESKKFEEIKPPEGESEDTREPEELEELEELESGEEREAEEVEELEEVEEIEGIEDLTPKGEQKVEIEREWSIEDEEKELTEYIKQGSIVVYSVEDFSGLVKEIKHSIVLEDGVYKIKEDMFEKTSEGKSEASEEEGSEESELNIGSLFGDEDAEDIFKDVKEEIEERKEEFTAHLEKEKFFPLTNRGLNYDEYLKYFAFSISDSALIKSFVETSRVVKAIGIASLIREEGLYTVDLKIGFEDHIFDILKINDEEPFGKLFLKKRNFVFVNKPVKEIKALRIKFPSIDFPFIESLAFLPLVYKNGDGYLILAFSKGRKIDARGLIETLNIV